MAGGAIGDRIRAFAAEAVSAAPLPDGAGGRLVAVGWATVELERAVAQLAAAFDATPAIFVDAAGSAALGARCLVADGVLDDALLLAVLEPSTEGRTAAGLARWDEGPLVTWYAASSAPNQASEPGHPWLPGPFGPERLVGGDPLTGPHRLLVRVGTGTIAT